MPYQQDPDNALIEVLLSYLAPSTYNEIQAILTQSGTCQQIIEFDDISCLNHTMWTSLSEDRWHASVFADYTR